MHMYALKDPDTDEFAVTRWTQSPDLYDAVLWRREEKARKAISSYNDPSRGLDYQVIRFKLVATD